MEIKTKFNVGDKVWYVVWNLGYKVKFAKISAIDIDTITKNPKDMQVWYSIKNSCCKTEEELFATKEEAQAECDRRNR